MFTCLEGAATKIEVGGVRRIDDDQFDVLFQQFPERGDRADVRITCERLFRPAFDDGRQFETGIGVDERGVEHLPRKAETCNTCFDSHS